MLRAADGGAVGGGRKRGPSARRPEITAGFAETLDGLAMR